MSYFPRTPNCPLVSVLIPTRGRPAQLCQAISSIYDLAQDKSLVEFILKIDDDDLETIECAKNLASALPLKAIVSPRGNGYHDMHTWVNTMSEAATGDWLFLFNDDARMATPDWDQLVLKLSLAAVNWHGVKDVCCIPIPTAGSEYAEEFMFLRRKVTTILGHYSLIPHNDTWIKTLMRMVNSSFFFDGIVVNHLVKETDDVIRKEGLPARQTTQYTVDGAAYNVKKLEDALALQKYIDANVKTVKYEITDADTETFLAMFNEPLGKVLEVACHDEPVSNILEDRGYDVYGVDLREYNPMQDLPGQTNKPECNYNYIRGDFCDLPDSFVKEHYGTFDCVISLSAIEHFGLGTYGEMPHPFYDVIAMRTIWNLLKVGGTAYISVPFGSEHIANVPHWRVYDVTSLSMRLIQDFVVENSVCIIADDAIINGKLRKRGDEITWDEATNYSGDPPHVSILLKLRKTDIKRKVPDGR
jgi:2-polyprenyl-3-methyl-5-hydroxy-6-metoxy-1,4-benzoquinol methylase